MKLVLKMIHFQKKNYSISHKFLKFLPKFKKKIDPESQKPLNDKIPYTNIKIKEIKLLKSKKVSVIYSYRIFKLHLKIKFIVFHLNFYVYILHLRKWKDMMVKKF